MWAKRSAPARVQKQPEIFIRGLIMRRARSVPLCGEGTVGSAMNRSQASHSVHRARARL